MLFPLADFVIDESFLALGLVIISSFVMGIATKITDEAEDRKLRDLRPFAWALVYAIIGIYLATQFPLANMWLAAALGALALGKIDSRPHMLAMVVFAGGIFLIGPNGIGPLHFLFFLIAAAADEYTWRNEPKILRGIAKHRLFLELAAILSDIQMGQLHYFGSILPFDAGYAGASYVLAKKFPKKKWPETKKN